MEAVEEDLVVEVVVEVEDRRNSGMSPLNRALKSLMMLIRLDSAQRRDDTKTFIAVSCLRQSFL